MVLSLPQRIKKAVLNNTAFVAGAGMLNIPTIAVKLH
jgi:hypothetical protein